MKRRILNPQLAAVVATLRHGELLYVGDSGGGIKRGSLYEMHPDVEYIDLEAVTGSPSFEDVIRTLAEAGDFEAAIVAEDMVDENPKDFNMLVEVFGENAVHQINFAPETYELRDRCVAMVQTGDIGLHANAILVAGYAGDPIELDILLGKKKYTTIPKKNRKNG